MGTIHLVVSEQVKNWIRKKGGIVTISLFEPVNCCAAGPEVTTSLRKPNTEQLFKHYKVDDISFFIHPHIFSTSEQLEITLKGFSKLKFLQVSGFRPF
ncbi:CC/Se motif family (seleno)protein [Bacillus alveayuensis]|uniref:CC/Se motif family (seleno)protein n=1 Tax=Aeribacillus alveayuensis TaxID=279215 RepID=UPI0005CD87D1|nr:CC/Se motif family (seleno)protein [Bacillus alveayuensis]